MSQDKDRIIGKVRKLLKLANTSKNSNVEEAASAAAKAQALMEKHRIKKGMLDSKDFDINWKSLNDKGRPETWKVYLVTAISKHNGCYTVRSENYDKDNLIHIVGENADIETVQELYTYIVRELIRLCLANILSLRKVYNFCPDASYNNSFYMGAITTIETKLGEAKDQTRSEEIKKAKSLIEKDKITNVLAKLDNKLQKAKSWVNNNLNAKIENIAVDNVDTKGYYAGQQAAKALDLNPNRPELK